MARPRRTRRMGLLSRFCADRTGATAVEFAFVSLVFFPLLIAIIQVAMVMFGNLALQTMTEDAARRIRVGAMKGKDFDTFKTALCGAKMSAMFDCGELLIQVQSFDDFSAASDGPVLNPKCFTRDPEPTSADCWKAGSGKQVVIVRVSYDWPFTVNPETLSSKTRITAVAAFRNEPFF